MSEIKSRGDVISEIAAETDLEKSKIDAVLKSFEGAVARSLATKGEVRMPGFGTFKTTDRAERTSRNPQTGEAMQVPARTAPRFVPGKNLKEAAGGNDKAKPKSKSKK